MPRTSEAWPAADRLFRSDARWRGGDDAYSIPLADSRTLWLFGDSFIAPQPGAARRECSMVHNSIAIQEGANPETAAMHFFWRGDQEQGPHAFFADDGDEWLWPGDGVRIGDALLLFFMRVRAAFKDGEPTGDVIDLWRRTDSLSFFQVVGWDARIVRNPDDDPDAWRIDAVERPDGIALCVGSAGVHVHDGHLYAAGFDPRDVAAKWRAPMWRWRVEDAASGDLRSPVDGVNPVAILDGAPTEFTIHPWGEGLLQVQTTGVFGAGVAARTAARPEGPWSPLAFLYQPPEADRTDALVYSAKAHPEQEGADLALTYATIGISADVTLDDEELYFPRFVRATTG